MSKLKTSRPGLTLMELVVVLAILVALATLLVPMMGGVSSNAQVTTTNATMTALRNAVVQYYQDMKGIPLLRLIPGTSITDSTGMPQTLKDLQIAPLDPSGNPMIFNPAIGRGWRGSYILQATGFFGASPPLDTSFSPTPSFGAVGDPAFLDGWGNPIVLQWPAVGAGDPSSANNDLLLRIQNVRLVSAGPPTKNVSGTLVSTIDITTDLMPTKPTTAFPMAVNNRGNDIVMFILTQDLFP